MAFKILNLTEDSIVTKYGTLFPGTALSNLPLSEIDLDDFTKKGLSLLSNNISLGDPGPPAWTSPTLWMPNIFYTNVPPANTVYYDNGTYICIEPHTSGLNFDPSKWQIIAKGLKGETGSSGVGIQGPKGETPWSFLFPWASNTNYTNTPPASIVRYENAVYVCKVNHLSTMTFDSSKWELAIQGSVGDRGPAGPSPWATPVAWTVGGVYTNIPPASVVTFNNESYACTVAHTATSTFDTTKFIKIAAKGLDGTNGTNGTNGGQGVQGNTGPASWAQPVAWAASTAYSNVAPASLVTYLGSSYVCIIAHTSTSTFDGTKFALIASKGDTGPTPTLASAAEIRQGSVDTKALSPLSINTALNFVSLTDAATVTMDFSLMFSMFLQLTDAVGTNRIIGEPTGITAAMDGKSGVMHIKNSPTGSRTISFAATSAHKFAGGTRPTLSTAANAEDRMSYVIRGTNVYWTALEKAFS